MTQELVIFFLRIGILVLLYLFLAQIAALILRDLKSPRVREVASRRRDFLLVVEGNIAGSSVGESIALEPVNSLGRAPGNTIRVMDDFTSSQHAVFNYKHKAWWVEDLGSTNGTFVNGNQITKPTKVSPGDLIQIGTSKLRFAKL